MIQLLEDNLEEKSSIPMLNEERLVMTAKGA